ncbi:cell division protein anillin-domain-containing protein [Mariannaea sp. PMI_226]|nr:cell division protein anillin-domain-containing protein [Mariannaea sp. PMI_226]
MATEQVHPLRITKTNQNGSPVKVASGIPRPLSELSPAEMRRNSPSWNQNSNGSPKAKKAGQNLDSSPFQSSPMDGLSPRLFWQNRNSENFYIGSPSPNRRSSIERLQKASRVRNSNILALEQKQEYDPTRIPQIERPLAKVQSSPFGSSATLRSSATDRPVFGHHRSESKTSIPTMSPTKSTLSQSASSPSRPWTPSKDQISPTKSSLSSRFKGGFDMETGTWSANSSINDHELPPGRSLHRHAKSVTFDAAPPQINEYEMATPDLSSVGTNSREGSYESLDDDEDDMLYEPGHIDLEGDSFDASLEDTDKTPVVGPDDWRGDSPMVQRGGPQEYEGSPMPENTPPAPSTTRPIHARSNSATSSGEHRPLPPLPGFGQSQGDSPAGSTGLPATAEKMLGSHRGLPSPPPASSASKLDIQSLGNGRMSLEERLRLMMLSDDGEGKSPQEQQRERRLRRAHGRERLSSPISEPESTTSMQEVLDDEDAVGDVSGLGDYQLPPRISRDSIMRKVGNKATEQDTDCNFSSPPASSPVVSRERQLPLDPDVPIPTTEDPMDDFSEGEEEEEEGSVIITRIPEDQIEFYEDSDFDEDDSELRGLEYTDSESHYSEQEPADLESQPEPQSEPQPEPTHAKEEPATPRATTPVPKTSLEASLPDIEAETKEASFSRDFESYMVPDTKEEEKKEEPKPELEAPKMADAQAFLQRPFTPEKRLSKPEYDGSGWGEPEDEYDHEPGTPDSVIHHPTNNEELEEPQKLEVPIIQAPAVPTRYATVKASNSKLKTRLSNTPSDIAAMREARRQVSSEIPDVPAIPDQHAKTLSKDTTSDFLLTGDDFIDRHPSFKNRSLTLDLDGLGLSLDKDFERVIEAQKRGYLMRQNTKLISASDKDTDEPRGARSVGNSPVKESRPMSCVVEPWSNKPRPAPGKSTRKRVGGSIGPVPPMPGQESNATAVKDGIEEDIGLEMATPESGERGRLFVKVMGVKDLDLPLPKNERTWFSLTLDNGVHCVTTAWLELARNAPIGQEFELVVPNDLEFQLSLNVKLEKPPVPTSSKLPPQAARVHKHKTSTFSRVFASPKKRKELEMRQREEEERVARVAQQEKEAQARKRNTPPSAYEMLSPLAAEDGSFARAYVCLREHENRCFGRPYMAEVACFNEWATEEASFASSVKSKRGNGTVVRKAPYKIGKLELQLLFVPRPKNATDEDMPKSMNSCIRELKVAEERMARTWEGHLSQQGGDCPYWRRRYFKLVGTKLTAYHEATRQPRATINLANAKRLIDDRRSLVEKETTGRGGRRRRSAFAEEEEGYMFVEEGFRIRFNNGELIDFYADTAEDKEGWMKVLADVVGRDSPEEDQRSRSKWCQLVLRREEQLRRRASGRRVNSRPKSMFL